MIAFVDHMTVVGLWAIAEQYLGKIYRQIRGLQDKIKPELVHSPYKWHEFNSAYANIGIDLMSCQKYQDANECRVLNNSIKHNPLIQADLEIFPLFAHLSGTRLDDVDLEMQRYMNAVSNFLGSLIEAANNLFP